MGIEDLGLIRQYSFVRGANYTDSPFELQDNELAESDNAFIEGGLKTIPGAARLVSTNLAGVAKAVTGVMYYPRKNGVAYFLAASANGFLKREDSGAWTNVSTNLSTVANTFWDSTTFNDTFIMTSGNNNVKKLNGTTIADLGGSPPKARFITTQGDYLFLFGYTSNPSQGRYNDAPSSTSHNTWPVGNTIEIGLDDGQIILGVHKFGESNAIFKERSVHLLTGSTPSQFAISPTLAEVGCIAPNSIVLTEAGLFFWSEAGPAIFNGVRTTLLGGRLKSILDTVDWDNPLKINAVYYPYKKHLLVSYQRTGQSVPDRALLLDIRRLAGPDTPWWVLNYGFTSSGPATDSVGRQRAYLGRSTGFVLAWDSGTTFDGTTTQARARTRVLTLGRPDHVIGVRDIGIWCGATSGDLIVRYAVDGASTFTTHTQSPVSMANSGKTLKYIRLDGDGIGSRITGRTMQLELVNNTTGYTIHGLELGVEDLGRRND